MIGRKIRKIRTEKNITRDFVAKSLNIPVKDIIEWENGSSEPSEEQLQHIFELLGTEL